MLLGDVITPSALKYGVRVAYRFGDTSRSFDDLQGGARGGDVWLDDLTAAAHVQQSEAVSHVAP